MKSDFNCNMRHKLKQTSSATRFIFVKDVTNDKTFTLQVYPLDTTEEVLNRAAEIAGL